MNWDYIEVTQNTWLGMPIGDRGSGTKTMPVKIAGDWSYGQDEFPGTSLIAILSWLGKDSWELVSATEHYQREDERERTAYLRRPVGSPVGPPAS